MPITIAIVEDDPRIRSTLATILSREEDCRCVGQYGSAEEALREIPKDPPEVVIMDINLPGINGVECVRRLSKLSPRCHILMLTVFNDTETIFNALRAGAVGYLTKPVRAAELLSAVRDVIGGGAPMTSSIARLVVQSFQTPQPAETEGEGLSPREREVLDYLAKGYLYKEIAEMMQVSYSTVRTHIERIYGKLHVQSRSQAVARYFGHEG
ncbi:MAG: response regulator transcription factor [Chthoniobacteraceae bacterium]|nr:response regulator transcription factor [Chthoniobacteraceae bacterium]